MKSQASKYGLFLFFLLVNFSTWSYGQSNSDAPINQRNFNKTHWKKITKGLHYNEKSFKKEPEYRERKVGEGEGDFSKEKRNERTPSREINHAFWSGAFKVFAIITGILLLLGIIYFLVKSGILNKPKSKNVDGLKKEFNLEEIEENLAEADVDSFLQQAINNKEYPLAIRLYYLNCIKQLSENKLIKWKRDKTNRTYMNELSGHELFIPFGEITPVFERVWYGNRKINEQDFNYLQPKFQQFLSRIKPLDTNAS